MTHPVLGIEVGAQSTLARLQRPDETPLHWDLPIGLASLWVLGAPSSAPSPLAIENAIQAVEDQIGLVQRHLTGETVLALAVENLSTLRRGGAMWNTEGGPITLARVEQEYQWLAARAMGAPSAKGTVFDAASGDALILILREFMHHLGVNELQTFD
ncbi:hypothetical protein LPB72_08645 [Hydrogenophaga crassostreae]|uniref:Ppx/GppA phosphatase domain-containing protein n=1 Tax=Hydrogenophaga crassostreae TaxID=1763535 RepID=A0A167I6S0_9BURK|nr:hypothetical protein [Hydrogenophaga crassostreae]AOW11872.1 hypothetical protein LPB072_02305 [Hydrogenophaga crassostreae]OAD42280.1 hypothetical protein LPB72_08645 [Hydrogenophaga crassostreae]